MSDTCPTVRVKSDTEQGYVIMNESDFDPAKHELYETAPRHEPGTLTVPQIRSALAEKGIEIPEGVSKKADLQALLDAASQPAADQKPAE